VTPKFGNGGAAPGALVLEGAVVAEEDATVAATGAVGREDPSAVIVVAVELEEVADTDAAADPEPAACDRRADWLRTAVVLPGGDR
jgi:hypothetical protein